jgi:hypothetical protein
VDPEVGLNVGPLVGPEVGPAVGPLVCLLVGPKVGPLVGREVGPDVGPLVGPYMSLLVGPDVGSMVGGVVPREVAAVAAQITVGIRRLPEPSCWVVFDGAGGKFDHAGGEFGGAASVVGRFQLFVVLPALSKLGAAASIVSEALISEFWGFWAGTSSPKSNVRMHSHPRQTQFYQPNVKLFPF